MHEIAWRHVHLVVTPDAEIARLATALRDEWRVDRGHCTGEPAFEALARAFGDRYVYAGSWHHLKLD